MVLLCIMDGFGLAPATPDNAIAAASKPNYDWLTAKWPHTRIDGSGSAVGLPVGQMGNSEVGHLNLGAGRVVYQNITRIDKSIADGDFFTNSILLEAIKNVAADGTALHLFGLVSDGKVHSSLEHLYALVRMARQENVQRVYLHAFMDGRDTPPESGVDYMAQVQAEFAKIGLGEIATLGGRYFGMDRDRRWERVDLAYRAIVHGDGDKSADPIEAIKKSYQNEKTDEFILPVVIDRDGSGSGRMRDGDCALFFNFRADRVRQLASVFLGQQIDGYDFPNRLKVEVVTMTEYDSKFEKVKVVFPPVHLSNTLGSVLAEAGMNQLRTAETEKYAHVTFFFNGGSETPFNGEDRDLIPSPKVATYDLKPEMSSVEVTDNAVKKILSGKYEFVLLNYANCDMVGHTGIFDAARQAVEAVDAGLGKLMEAVRQKDGVAIVTADHGNAEMMVDPQTGSPWTAHTTNLVPCIVYDPAGKIGNDFSLREGGVLADIAPTVIDILSLEKPVEMTGKSLIQKG